jgi:hypothetical protein
VRTKWIRVAAAILLVGMIGSATFAFLMYRAEQRADKESADKLLAEMRAEKAGIWPVAKNLQHLLLTPEAGL